MCVLSADFIVFVRLVSEHFFLELLESHLDSHDVFVNSVVALGLFHFPDEFVVVRKEQLDISVRRPFCTAETGDIKLNAFNKRLGLFVLKPLVQLVGVFFVKWLN